MNGPRMVWETPVRCWIRQQLPTRNEMESVRVPPATESGPRRRRVSRGCMTCSSPKRCEKETIGMIERNASHCVVKLSERGFAQDAKEAAKTRERVYQPPIQIKHGSQHRTTTTSTASPPRLKNIPAAFQFLGMVSASLWAGRPPVFGLISPASIWVGRPAGGARSQGKCPWLEIHTLNTC